jgi:hypothetical protein
MDPNMLKLKILFYDTPNVKRLFGLSGEQFCSSSVLGRFFTGFGVLSKFLFS